MEDESQRPEGREGAIPALNAAIESLNPAENASSIGPARAVFDSATTLLTMIRVCFLSFCNDLLHVHTPGQDSMVNEPGCVELGLFCADICRALNQGVNGKKEDELSRSARNAINLLAL